ncbi:MAG: hypothetical protein SNG35_01710 [Rikenellaceae bacterium]
MRLGRVKSEVAELNRVVESWSGLPSDEQVALALAMVKGIYAQMRFSGVDEDEVCAESAVVEPEPVVVEPEPVIPEPVAPEPEPIVVEPEPVIPEPEPTLPEPEPIEPESRTEEQRRERIRKIISLYGDITPHEQPVEQIEPVEQSSSEPVVLNDVQPTNSIISMLTLNDRFLLSNDLFGGNMVELNNALQLLDNQQSLDDVLLLIAQNYRWRGDSDGAKLLNTLLKNRYNE